MVLAVALVSSGTVQAQAPGSEDVVQLEETLVTARKRVESVQDVPLAIVPFQTEQLERRDIQNMEDLAGNTIGLSYNGGISSGVQGSVTIRGLATSFVQDRFQNVGIYIDGLYLQRQSMMNIGMVDLARVEVVKGPQNALYGRNAFAGAINYVTQRPSEELEGYLLTTQGSDDREDYRGAISGMLVQDKLYARAAFGVF
jgi:iron complex outermembrane receptor protein